MAKSKFDEPAAVLFIGAAIVSRIAVLDFSDRVVLTIALAAFALVIPIKHENAETFFTALGLAAFIIFLTKKLFIP